jgi:hypothetical protein
MVSVVVVDETELIRSASVVGHLHFLSRPARSPSFLVPPS